MSGEGVGDAGPQGGRAGPMTASARGALGYEAEGDARPLGLGLTEAEEGAGPSDQKRRGKDFPFSNPFLFSFLNPNSSMIQIKFKWSFKYTFQFKQK